MRIRITLATLHGHTDRQEIDVDLLGYPDFLANARISSAVKTALDAWSLLPGDIIKIEDACERRPIQDRVG